MKRNLEHDFVKKTVDQIGYPRWDKRVVIDASKTNQRNLLDSTKVVYIPFVRDSQNYVNASMAITLAPEDTSYRFLCDWEYADKSFAGSYISDTTAEKFAMLFMILGNSVFGDTSFKIVDNRLFHRPGEDISSVRKYVTFHQNDISGRANLLVTMCYNFTYWSLIPDWHCTQSGDCLANGVCDECSACVDWSLGQVNEQQCFNQEIGGGGSGGTGSGGGGSSGGDTPPECPGGPVAPVARTGNVTDPCTPGWEPGSPNLPENPCIKLNDFKSDSYFKNAFQDLKDKANPNVPVPENKEYVYRYQTDGVMIGPIAGEPNKCEVEQKTLYMSVLKAYLHSHNPGCPEPLFSPGDIQLAFDLFKSNKIVYPFVFAVATAQGNYVMVINDVDAFNNFGSKYFLDDSPYEPADLDKTYKSYKLSLTRPAAHNETLFLEFLKRQNGAGIELLKTNSDFSQYERLILGRSGQLITTPCD